MPLTGELSFATVPALLARAEEWQSEAVIDLSAVTQADSAGLAFLLELSRRAKKAGGAVRYTQVPAQLAALIAFFELDSVLEIA